MSSRRFAANAVNLRAFSRNRDGAAAVEFAIIMTPLITILLMALQTAIIFLFDQALQSVAQQAARQLMTGSAQMSSLTQAQYRAAVCALAPSPFQCANIMVDVQSATSFSTLSTAPLTLTYNASNVVTNSWSYSPGNPGDVVIMRVMYNWPVLGGALALNLANQPNNNRLLVATVVFKNEPY
jgi:Flp pilus assembly protein TadG